MTPGIYFDIPEERYHADDFGDGMRLSVSIAQALVLESEAHARLRHPKLGGRPIVPTTEMDRGTLMHALLLGKGRRIEVIECDNWKKPVHQEMRDAHRSAGRVAVTRPQYDAAAEGAEIIRAKLGARGYQLAGQSEVTILWEEEASNGAVVRCRARVDHLEEAELYDLKITGDANPRTLTRGHITRMGYDIQGTAYPRALEFVDPRLRGRTNFTLLFCEPEPPYCITPVCLAGSLRALGSKKWQRAVDRWERCTRTGEWRDYTDSVVWAEAKPWELEEEGAEDDANAA
jgi:hypothetical protein